MWRALVVLAVAAVAAGGTLVYFGSRGHGHPQLVEHLPRLQNSTLPNAGVSSPADLARVLCQSAIPGPLFSSEPTTVGELRATTMGTRPPTQDTLYPRFSADSFAAWCWGGGGPYDVYEVTADAKAHLIGRGFRVPAAEAHGAPSVP
jgi:hypothetical protein